MGFSRLLLGLVMVMVCINAVKSVETRPCFTAIYSFGDSLTDTGNALASSPLIFSQIGSSPYGETYFHKPTGRCSNGRLVIDFLGKQHSLNIHCVYSV